MTTLRGWYLAGRRSFIHRLAAVGAASGVASWLLALALHPLFGAGPPSLGELLLGVSLGALVGAVLGLVLRAFWDRRSHPREGDAHPGRPR